jgi:hypothetical protein
MLRRSTWFLAALVLVLAACSSDKTDDASAPSSTATSAGPAPTQATPSPDSSSTSTSLSIPPVTPPANLPVACDVLSEAAFAGSAIDGSKLVPFEQAAGAPAPSSGCRWEGSDPVALVLYYGQDPLETLALVRVQNPNGADVTGVGQDAYFVAGTLFVDTGSQAFAVNADRTSDQLKILAQNVLTNL